MLIERLRAPSIVLAAGLLVACASSPVAPEGVTIAPVGPAHALADESHLDQLVIWGGQIIEVENQADQTLLVVASYPLDRSDRPRLDTEPGVRFIAEQSGFLEPLTFAPGRFVTLLGRVQATRTRAVGAYAYEHPVLLVDRIHLWPVDPALWTPAARWQFGIGIQL